MIEKLKYEGARLLKVFKAINRILNLIVNFTAGSHCKSTNERAMSNYFTFITYQSSTHVLLMLWLVELTLWQTI